MEDGNGLGYLLEVKRPRIADGYEMRKGEKSTKEKRERKDMKKYVKRLESKTSLTWERK